MVVVAAGLGWFLADLANVMVIKQFGVLAMFYGLVIAVLGWREARKLTFPLFYLVFAIPFGQFLVPYLQDATAQFVVGALRSRRTPATIMSTAMYCAQAGAIHGG